MSEDFKTYLGNIKFEKYLKNLKNKIGKKTIIFYGSGSFFQYIKGNYDLSDFNVIGISDMKFMIEDEGKDCLGYKIIPKDKIKEYNPDFVLISTIKYTGILENFVINEFNGTKIKVYPLARIPLIDLIKEIWKR